MTPVVMAQGDTLPPLEAVLNDTDGPINLTGATVTFRMTQGAQTVINNQPCTVTNPTGGQVTYAWQTGDTATPGEYGGQFKVTTSGGTFHFPNAGPFPISIEPTI